MALSTLNREVIKKNLSNEEYDVVIIGGGITGAGIALDASQRGMKVALVEMQDFAQGTSSRSTKLVHGGLRYLKQAQIKVVAETGKERAIVYENGPHVTTPEWMLLPMHKGGTFGKFTTNLGLTMYDRLAGVKRYERKKMLSKKDTLNKEPLVKKDGLKGGGYYVEYRTDDARLTIEVMKRAEEKGAEVINHTKSTNFIYNSKSKVNGIEVQDLLTGETYQIKAKKVINAAGPWVDEVRKKDYTRNNKQLRLTKGVHVVIDQSKFPLRQAVYFDTEKDGRMIFAIPREGKAYVGTTDTFYDNEKAKPLTTQEDRDYLIDAINYMFPGVNVKDEDIESTWAGVRPLILEDGKDPSEISRKDEIWEGESGLLTIAGGKLTGYRHMALEIVDLLAKRLKQEHSLKFAECATKETPISGGDVGGSDNFDNFVARKVDEGKAIGLDEDVAYRLASKYGSNVDLLFNIAQIAKDKDLKLPLELYVQLVYSVQHEMVYKPTDFLVRRTGKLYFNINEVKQYKDLVIDELGKLLNYTQSQKNEFTKELNLAIQEATHGNDQLAVKK
ncbi:glycerol-3-phosphate dehydrogenase/oxidase [Staphylococcus devriesei]|uniref:Glycerol-3-phosphate dehydrogenase n=1 Tax=Staphylococcus devriesei TaxID=586733 RepID=A0ABX5I233_9STAP|nr:glycerol-3-phosphate dehydrogenase/oxidase [Staphylococcus devriesei]MCE5096178.1 glycerol-3-phosphate dehydrogenase/oxidase [Staphylococcus devriesei]PNZ88747.1 glycerol-3-phosphate dehydrogenase [Staphylococcus devriesei]PTF14393.1 glycerol-3-phosphate dehydrogenase/oxidase [Staphylococcus devriesei]PTF19330.1 glycerol-3-phosphate dehydrogenase/oxidase [Staphylococcus devriesei]SUM03703.1 aerobic glycerol-3-phosphate dehydrogenase [Staphylococcus devriesei]